MPTYRLCLHATDESLVGEEARSASTDADAIRLAQAALTQHEAIMIWQGDRFVQRVTRLSDGRPPRLWD